MDINQGHSFDVTYVKNGNSYDVGPNGEYTEGAWVSLLMTLKGYRSRSQCFDAKYLRPKVKLENGMDSRSHGGHRVTNWSLRAKGISCEYITGGLVKDCFAVICDQK